MKQTDGVWEDRLKLNEKKKKVGGTSLEGEKDESKVDQIPSLPEIISAASVCFYINFLPISSSAKLSFTAFALVFKWGKKSITWAISCLT